MKIRLIDQFKVVVVALVAMILAPGVVLAQADDEATPTEDIIYLYDGREFHGQIVNETEREIKFEFVARGLNITTKITFQTSDIARIVRDVEVEIVEEVEPTKPTRRRSASSQPDENADRGYSRLRANSTATHVPGFYIIPMKGQMGTDINATVYRELLDDIRAHDPEVIVIEFDSADVEDTFEAALGDIDREEVSLPDFDDYKLLVNLFRDDLRDIRQVVWLHDAHGIGSTVAMAWDELYMTSDSRLGGMDMVIAMTGADKWSDDDVRAKMMAAWTGSAQSLVEHGGYARELALAMMMPEYKLSASFKGRQVVWGLNELGEYLVDNSEENTVIFSAKDAEDLMISDGTADNLDDLALLLGYREYRVLDTDADPSINGYVEDWRNALDKCQFYFDEYNKFMSWASGEDTLQYLGRAKRQLESIVRLIDKYRAVEIRLERVGVSRFNIETQIEQLKEQMRALQNRRGGARGGGGRGMGSGG